MTDDGEDAEADYDDTKTIQTIEDVEEESRGLKNTLGMDELQKIKYKHKHKKHTQDTNTNSNANTNANKNAKTKTNTHKNSDTNTR